MEWTAGVDGFRRRRYSDYQEYLRHQSAKRTKLEGSDFLDWYHPMLRSALVERIPDNPHLEAGDSVICLAARSGAELEAFAEIGCRPVGIDLEPMGAGVIYGDFHYVPFGDQSFDVAYTNSLDHVYDEHRFLQEIRRVTKRVLILECGNGGPQKYESFAWEDPRKIRQLLGSEGLEVIAMTIYAVPWGGIQMTAEIAQ